MDRFNEPIVITPLSDGKTWKLLSDLRYEVGGPNSDDVIIVPVGFYTDFASIPHMFRRFLPRWGKYGYASIIHDFLYWKRKKKRHDEPSRVLWSAEHRRTNETVSFRF